VSKPIIEIKNYDKKQKFFYDSMGNVSDGYHTFNELYEFRMLYNAALFNELAEKGDSKVHKSYKHSDGELCFGGGWFIVVAYLDGQQISNHYENKDWELFKVEERELADKWDGHTPEDVMQRLRDFILEQK
jgi:hypothetical protein